MKKRIFTFIAIFCFFYTNAQETLPIYQDYLSDNVFLIHPAAAGVGECAKIRLTARMQWLDIDNAPELQTGSFHTKLKAGSKAAYGGVLFNDKNGNHSQKGIQGTYAYHLEMSSSDRFNQLSFGLSMAGVFNQIDQRNFANDPAVEQVVKSNVYFNADLGMAYHFGSFSSYLTIKNILLTGKGELKSEHDALNLRNYVLGAGYYFGNMSKFQFEPSFMFQYKEQTSEKVLDLNAKVYKQTRIAQFWGAVSYRQTFDGGIHEQAKYISPILGLNFDRFMFSYTYTYQLNTIRFADEGFHQFSLGMNLRCSERRLPACPNINGTLF